MILDFAKDKLMSNEGMTIQTNLFNTCKYQDIRIPIGWEFKKIEKCW